MAQRQIGATFKLPNEIISSMEDSGAKVIRRGKKEMICVSFKANSDAHKRYIELCSRSNHLFAYANS